MSVFQVFVAWMPQTRPQGRIHDVLKIGITSPCPDGYELKLFR